MKLRVTVSEVYEADVDGDDFDKAVKEIKADVGLFMKTATRMDAGIVDCVEEVSERV